MENVYEACTFPSTLNLEFEMTFFHLYRHVRNAAHDRRPAIGISRAVQFSIFATMCFVSAGSVVRGVEPEGQAYTSCFVLESGKGLGSEVQFNATIPNPIKGHTYSLRYQVRIQEKKGEVGTLLGLPSNPGGVAFPISSLISKQDGVPIRISASEDIVRFHIRKMTNIPKKGRRANLILRIEPQVFVKETGKYLTEHKTLAAIFIATVDGTGHVESLQNIFDFLVSYRNFGFDDVSRALGILEQLDKWDADLNQVPEAISELLSNDSSSVKIKIAILNSTNPKWLASKSKLKSTISRLKLSNDERLLKIIEKLELDSNNE